MNKELYKQFLEERKLIAAGSTADIYYWQGFAYKCFNDGYPDEWIEHEYNVQKQIVKSKLNVAKYYRSGFKRIIKMDYLKGKSLASSYSKDNINELLEDFINQFIKIHEVNNLKLEKLSDFLKKQITKAPVESKQKTKAKNYIKEIETKVKETDCLCHMDYHFLNTMYVKNDIYVIDWVDARSGKAIYDYARTYVMIYEYAAGFKHKYLKKILALMNYDKDIFTKAIYVNAINRLEENDDKRVRKLIELIEEGKFI